MRKIIFGGHWTDLPGWEIYTEADHDLTKPLGFETDSIDFIFTEHVIEHLELGAAINYFKECKRILKPGGIVRTVMPFLDKICNPREDLTSEYGKEYFKNNISPLFNTEEQQLNEIGLTMRDIPRTFQINGLFYRCGHKFIWSSKLITKILLALKYQHIHEWEAGHGLILNNCIEHRQRGINMSMNPEEEKGLSFCLDYEGFAIEAVK